MTIPDRKPDSDQTNLGPGTRPNLPPPTGKAHGGSGCPIAGFARL